MNDKYELTNGTINIDGHTLHRIKALKDMGHIQKGDLGGFIESEENLSTSDKSWVDDYAAVYDHARVDKNSIVRGSVKVYDFARVTNNARVSGSGSWCGHTVILGHRKNTLWSILRTLVSVKN